MSEHDERLKTNMEIESSGIDESLGDSIDMDVDQNGIKGLELGSTVVHMNLRKSRPASSSSSSSIRSSSASTRKPLRGCNLSIFTGAEEEGEQNMCPTVAENGDAPHSEVLRYLSFSDTSVRGMSPAHFLGIELPPISPLPQFELVEIICRQLKDKGVFVIILINIIFILVGFVLVISIFLKYIF